MVVVGSRVIKVFLLLFVCFLVFQIEPRGALPLFLKIENRVFEGSGERKLILEREEYFFFLIVV